MIELEALPTFGPKANEINRSQKDHSGTPPEINVKIPYNHRGSRGEFDFIYAHLCPLQ
jgi:hypothetical protein